MVISESYKYLDVIYSAMKLSVFISVVTYVYIFGCQYFTQFCFLPFTAIFNELLLLLLLKNFTDC